MRKAIFHPKALETIKSFPVEVRKAVGKTILDLQKGHHLALPISKPMPSVESGVEELRMKDANGAYRTFYYKKYKHGILIFHAFMKKTQKTSFHDLEIGRKRLKEMLYEKI